MYINTRVHAICMHMPRISFSCAIRYTYVIHYMFAMDVMYIVFIYEMLLASYKLYM